MNYANLLARGLLIPYCIFLLLFAFEEGILEEGYMHALPAVVILAIMVVFKERPLINFFFFLILSLVSIWFFKTYNNFTNFLIISAPLGVASILFLVAREGKLIEK